MSNLSILYGIQLHSREYLIVFDEVQKYPRARELIKYLVQDGRYDYIETGSLISIKDNVKDIQIPSEEESVQMVPMDFEEWLWANGEDQTIDMIREHFDRNEPLGQQIHKITLDKFRLYMIVGGMPGAVSAYLKNMEITDSEKIKHQIIDLYRNDMHKKGPTRTEHSPHSTRCLRCCRVVESSSKRRLSSLGRQQMISRGPWNGCSNPRSHSVASPTRIRTSP